MHLYWGDLHNHCGISYGYGSLENALGAAKEQLDFCAIIGHASWHDIPSRTKELEYLVDFHLEGFQRLEDQWDYVLKKVKDANQPHEFVTFQGYEIHSRHYGDHHILSPEDDLPLVRGEKPRDTISKLLPQKVIALPHHVGYAPGYRGANWESFDSRISPIVEVYSKHGSGMSEDSAYPYLHDMGPRDSRNMIYAAIKKGLKFGFVGSTDHHAGYPGSYGDGRVAVLANEKTRDSIWEALLARRTYAVTGDKIECDFRINDHHMGSEIADTGNRNIELDIKACDAIDKVVIYKNLKPWKIVNGETLADSFNPADTYKIRLEMGWGTSDNGYGWHGRVSLSNGRILDTETCFRGRSVLAPTSEMKDDPSLNDLNNKLIEQRDQLVEWTCTTFKNPTTLHPHTSGLILEVNGSPQTELDIELNQMKMTVTIGELLEGSRSIHREIYNSEALLIHRAVPFYEYTLHGEWQDVPKEKQEDVYHVEARQMNNQWAWVSPIYITS